MMRFFTLLLCVSFFASANSQTVIWGGPGDANGEFDGGLNDWTVNAVSPNEDALWIWEADGAADQGAYIGTRGPITSPSVANGAMAFDSDFYDNAGEAGNFGNGLAASPQVGELISPVFSCEGYESVSLTWFQYTRQFQSTFEVHVTNDGGATWTIYSVSDNNNIPVNSESATDNSLIINISDAAANQAEVQFKFVYNADYYFWIIDDVAVIETPDIDLEMSNMFFPFQGFNTPSTILNADTLQFAAEVINVGGTDQTGGTITASILEGTTPKYTFSQDFGALAVGDTAFVVFDDEVLPEDIDLVEGLHTVTYDVVSADGEDFFPGNNGLSEAAEITADFFTTNNGIVSGLSFNGGDFAAATVIRTGELPDNFQYRANTVTTGGACNGGNGIQNAGYNIFVFKVLNQLGEELDPVFAFTNFGDLLDEHENLEFAGYSFNTVIAGENFAENTTELLDADDDLGIVFEENSTYIVAVDWDFAENPDGLVFVNYSNRIAYYQLVSIVYIPAQGWFTTVFEDNIGWGIGVNLTTETIISNEETELAAAAVKIYPNPAMNFTNVELNFEEATDAVILMRDAKGSFITSKSVTNATSENVEFDITNLPAGNYSFEITTTSGATSVRSFVVAK